MLTPKFIFYSVIIHFIIILIIGILLLDTAKKMSPKQDKEIVFNFTQNDDRDKKSKQDTKQITKPSEQTPKSTKQKLKSTKNIESNNQSQETEKGHEPKKEDKLKPLKESPKESQPTPKIPVKKKNWKDVMKRVKQSGGVSFNTYEWNYMPYLEYLKKTIQGNLNPPYAFTYLGIIHGDVLMKFRIYPDGELRNVKLIFSNCHSSLEDCSRNSITFSAPFRTLPQSFPEKFLEITTLFSYINKKEKK